MSTTATFRLPGVYFLPAPRPQPIDLPPLDVAGFVGFATRGPLDVPVPVNDLASFDAIFGGPFAVARDANGKPVYAYLRDAVACFFGNGGARCYVTRVAGNNAAPAQFVVPGIVAIDVLGQISRAAIDASSPGTWGNTLRCGTLQTTTLLPSSAFAVNADGTVTWATHGAPLAVQQGDVLRLTFADDLTQQWLFPVATVTKPKQDFPQAVLGATAVWPVTTAVTGSLPMTIVAVRRVTSTGPASLAIAAEFTASRSGIELSLSGQDRLLVARNDLLLLDLANGSQQALTVADVQATPATGSVPDSGVAVSAVAMVQVGAGSAGRPLLPTGSTDRLVRVERLQLTLRIRYGDATTRELERLGFNANHARFWGDIAVAESGSLAGGAPTSSGTSQTQRSQALAPGAATTLYAGLFSDQRADLDWTDPRLGTVVSTLLAPPCTSLTYLPVGMAVIGNDDDLVAADASSPASDDLARFDGKLFLDPRLGAALDNQTGAIVAPSTLLAAATDLYFLQNVLLKGIHSLMFVDEVALIAVPDAVQMGWTQSAAEPVPASLPTPVRSSPTASGFQACFAAPTVHSVDPTNGAMIGGTTVTITGSAFKASSVVTVRFGGVVADSVVVASNTTLTCLSPPAMAPGPVAVTVSNSAGAASLASGFFYLQASTEPPLPLVNLPDAADPQWLQMVHVALINLCEARGDAVAILAQPLDFEKQDCVNWLQSLRQNLGLPRHGVAFPYASNITDLSYAAVYHPWLLVSHPDGPAEVPRPMPPDGAICGAIAAREIATQAWVAPANVPLTGVLDLRPSLSDDDWAALFALGFNLVRREARDFRVMSAHTLADDQSLLQLSVRRLLIQLRKAVLQRGQAFVFANNDAAFRQRVRSWLESLLRRMFNGGAFAGANQQSSYRVIVDDSVNPQSSMDQGQMVAQILIAPSQPMEFLTVLLTRTGQGPLQAAEA